MKVYNQYKTQELENYDLTKGYLKDDYLIHNYPEIKQVKEVGHYETIHQYGNGGKDVNWIVDIKGNEYQAARVEKEDILVYIPYSELELRNKKLEELRNKREVKCFSIVNRGKLWYDKLNNDQLLELNNWYKAWLDVTITLIEPSKPIWLK